MPTTTSTTRATTTTTTLDGFNQTSTFQYQKPSFDSLIDKTLLKIEVLIMSLAFTFALIGNLMVIFTLMFRRYVKKRLSTNYTHNRATTSYVTGAAVSSTVTGSHGAHHTINKPYHNKPYRSKFTRMNFFILNLSIADVYVSLGNILTMLLWRMNNNLFYGGDIACRAVAYFQLVSVYYSTYVLITMTIDRYEAICKPLIGLGWSKTRGFVYICIAFCLSHLQGIPQLIFFSLRDIEQLEPPVKTCYAVFNPVWLQSAYILYTFVMQFLIPLSIIIGCYASISLRVLDSIKNKSKTTTKLRSSDDASRKMTTTSFLRANSSALPSSTVKASMSSASGVAERSRLVDGIGEDDGDVAITNEPKCSTHRLLAFLNPLSSKSAKIKKEATLSSYSLGNMPINNNSNYNMRNVNNNSNELRQHCTKNFSRSKMKTIKLTLTVIVMYIFCSTPYFVGMLMNLLLDPSKMGIIIKYFMVLSCLLFQLNSCVNPWYVYFGLRSFH